MATFRTSEARSLFQKAQADVKAIEFRTKELIKKEIINSKTQIQRVEEKIKAEKQRIRSDAKVQRDMNIEQNKREKMAIKSKYIGQISTLSAQADKPSSELKEKIDQITSKMENELDIYRNKIEQIRSQIRTNLDAVLLSKEKELNDAVFKIESASQERINTLERESAESIGKILQEAEAAAREVDENLSGIPNV